ncbi:serine/threonine-protein kinase [Miltoncostaea marina]|uniref:serine/threonine-protein kinase n=1 Tax=Miltoncostaea marina TaxID=2843215 RepID=UPI001C3CF988|nr:serine/threonine-protein kinase [Miltoncostaea marina]
MSEAGSWGFAEGDEIAPGRHAVRLLGGGTRFEAYLAWDDALLAMVVVKVLRPGHAARPDALEGLAAEVEALRRLQHPAIVRSFGHALVGRRPHVVLEFLDGPRLSTLLRRHGMAIEQALSLGLQLCSAVHYMGRAGVVHLDIKPSNVIMGAPPRLIDLSVARTLDALAGIPAGVGTDAYMAPEQADPARLGEIGPASDVWGLGATLYEALCGRRAVPRPRAGGPRHPQLSVAPEPIPARAGVPPAVAAAVMACMSPSPADRPSAAEVAAVLEPAVAALPKPRLGRFRPGVRRG